MLSETQPHKIENGQVGADSKIHSQSNARLDLARRFLAVCRNTSEVVRGEGW